MAKILIIFSTQKGQTEKIAHFIGKVLVREGHVVDIFNIKKIRRNLDLNEYSGVVLGGPVLMHGYSWKLKRWIQSHVSELTKIPTAFFSVCLGILQKQESVQIEERNIVQNFFTATGWQPKLWTIFAGALSYTRYNWLMKIIMRNISRKVGRETDMSRDFEYTNWDDVNTFSKNFLQTIENK